MLSQLCINTITNYRRSLPEALELYRRHGIRFASLWREKIDEIGVVETRHHLANNGITPITLCGWYNRRKSEITVSDKKRTLDVAAELGAGAVTLLAPGMDQFPGTLENCRLKAFDQTAEILEHAREVGVRLAIEPIHPRLLGAVSSVNTIAQAIDWCKALGDGIGIELDVANVWWDPDLSAQVRRAAKLDLLMGLQICDVTAAPMSPRVMMGDGIVDLVGFVDLMKDAGYRGHFEVELIGEALWDLDEDAYLRRIISSCDSLLRSFE